MRHEEVIKEEVILASENQTEEVEDIYENQDMEEETSDTQPESGQEILENQHFEASNTCQDESQIPHSDDVLDNQKKVIGRKENEMHKYLQTPDKTDPKKVLIDNLKVLGLSKAYTKMLKDSRTRKSFKRIMSKPTRKLPCPVPLMSTDQLIEWIYPEIPKDFIEQGLPSKTHVSWGNPKFHPRFWPDELWPQKHKRPYNVSLVDTLKAAVSNRLKFLNINPETYISEEYTEEEDIKKRKVRGLK